jgi:hypothetical protein
MCIMEVNYVFMKLLELRMNDFRPINLLQNAISRHTIWPSSNGFRIAYPE